MQATAENWPSGYPANGTQLHEELSRNQSFLPTFLTVDPLTKLGVRQEMIPFNGIGEAHCESVILETVALDPGQEVKVLPRFKAERDDAYEEFIDKCDDFEAEVAKGSDRQPLHILRTGRERRRSQEAPGLADENPETRLFRR
ncbi:MAG: Chromate resistance protein ChrB [Pseudodonghicola sp.]|uniref:Chromate resistance protein ChrB n=1 Tax=Celeribacter persicus TaxID=1651082 RepID=UPI001B8667C8|nr:Chromate resistance protein ChrB [Celeribacter persicus]